MPTWLKRALGVVGLVAVASLLGGCALFGSIGDRFEFAFKGVSATMTTYNEDGQKIDQVHGKSFNVSRDDRFDTTNSDGTSKNDSSVLLISLGNSHISHVGSSMVMAEDGIINVSNQLPPTVSFQNAQNGMPWLNNVLERYRNLWHGKAKTLMIRSQNGSPIAIYAGDSVDVHATDVPKSTWFRIDGKSLLVYRCDYTMYDNDLLQ